MDKIYRVYLSLVLLLAATTVNAQQIFKVDGIYYKYTDKSKTSLMVCSVPNDSAAYSGDIDIPVQVTITDTVSWDEPVTSGMTIIKIDKEAFRNSKIKSIKMTGNIREIGSSAFLGCGNLTKAYFSTIPELVSIDFKNSNANPLYIARHLYIGDATEETKDLVIPNDVTTIGSYAFAGAECLESIKIPASVRAIHSQAFLECTNLKKAIFDSADDLCRTTFDDRHANPLNNAHHLFVGDNTQEETAIVIPDDVTTISAGAFAGCSEIIKVTIHAHVTSIGNDAFYGCSNLYTVDYPSLESLTTVSFGNDFSNPMRFCKLFLVNGSEMSAVTINSDIYDNAFYGAKWLENVKIGSAVKVIGKSAFRDCINLRTITIDDGSQLEYIKNDAFNGCKKMEAIALPPSLKSIGIGAFRGCSQLSRITIPSNTTSLDREIFVGCILLTEAEINANTAYIPEKMFMGCTSLARVTLSSTIETIKDEAFSGCTSLTALPQGGNISNIYEKAFANCSGFRELTLPVTVTTIGKRAFANCKNLSNLFIPKEASSLTIGTEAFEPDSIKNIYAYPATAPKAKEATNPFGEKIDGINLFYNENGTGYDEKPWNEMKRKVFSKKRIVYFVDSDSIYCDSIQVGDKVNPRTNPTKKGWDFSGWIYKQNGKVADIPSIMPDHDLDIHGYFTTQRKIGNLVYLIEPTKTETKVVADAEAYKSLSNAAVPDSIECEGKRYHVAVIDENAFRDCKNLQEITFSDSLLRIGQGAFINCNQLLSVKLPKKITLIPDSLFYNCSGLIDVTMPNSIKAIGASAFNRCSSLNLDSLPSQLDSLGELAFCKSGITFMSIPQGVTMMGNSVFLDCSQMDSIRFESGFAITRLPDYTFQNCKHLMSFTLAPATTSIGTSTFSGCSSITLLNLDNGIKEIGSNAFSGCTELKDVTLPETIETLQANAFSGCNAITQITVNKPTAPSAAGSAFSNATYDTASLYVPDVDNYSSKSPWNKFIKRILSIADNPLIYWVDGQRYGDTIIVRVGKPITPLPAPQKENRAFTGWRGMPSVMPNDTVIVTGAFKYQRIYQDADTKEEVYTDSLFYGDSFAEHSGILPQELAKDGYRYEIADTVLTMPANDTIINVRYYMVETDFAYNGLTYHLYTEGDEPHAELMPGSPVYSKDSYDIPDSIPYMHNKYAVTVVRNDAFKGCYKLKSVNLPSTIKAIGTQAFAGCYALNEIVIPKNTETLGNEMFLRCSNLKNVIFDDSSKIELLPANLLMGCKAIETIDLPTSLKTFANDVFRGCSSLKEITIPQNVTSIGEYAFLGCDKLEKIYIANETTLPDAFENTFDENAYDRDTLYVSKTLQANMKAPWDKFNVDLGGATTAEKCAKPKVYYSKGTLKFECETPGAEIKSEITVSDAIKIDNASNQELNKKYTIKAYATAVGYKRSDPATATIEWREGKPLLSGFETPIEWETEEEQQGGIPGDMNGDGQVTAEDAAMILRKLVGKEVNNNEGE
ncbi:MAG: leucine-rich repeat protein [Prevotella sp.]|nr:leucine-rich repeat protein [Prevotella sp.]